MDLASELGLGEMICPKCWHCIWGDGNIDDRFVDEVIAGERSCKCPHHCKPLAERLRKVPEETRRDLWEWDYDN